MIQDRRQTESTTWAATRTVVRGARWVALAVLAAAGPAAPGPCARTVTGDGERDVRARLRAIAEAAPDSAYQGDAGIRRAARALGRLGPEAEPRARIRALFDLGTAELRFGREAAAIEHLEAALALFPERAPWAHRARLLYALGVASLRRAETENCCRRNEPESCLVPLAGGALHARPAGAEAAVRYLTELVEAAPADEERNFQAEWLLNVAYMALGRYPDGVPPEHRVDPERFRPRDRLARFPNVARELGLDTFSLAGGAVVEDLDGDGDYDVLTSSHDVARELALYRNDGPDGFRECHAEAGLSGLFGGLNLIQADYDDDGAVDVLVLRGAWLRGEGRHPNSLLRNAGTGAEGWRGFDDVTFREGLGEVHLPTQTAGWADYDGDGDLDLYVGNEHSEDVHAPCQLFRNDGPRAPRRAESRAGSDEESDAQPGAARDRRFVDVAAAAGVENLGYTKGVAWGDYDLDGDEDLYVSNIRGENRLYRNAGDGTFEDVARELGVQRPIQSFPTWFWDYDNDGALDLFVAGYASTARVTSALFGAAVPGGEPCLYRNRGDGTFEDVAAEVGLDRPVMPMGSNFGDLDNDGFLDFYLGTGNPDLASVVPNLMFRNDGGRRFQDVTVDGGFGHLQKGHGIAFADVDLDGDQDVFAQLGGAYQGDGYYDALFRNPGTPNRWLGIALEGTASNRSAIGARIAVTAAGPSGERTVHRRVGSGGSFGADPLEEHVGLGDAERVVAVVVTWPATGAEQRVEGVPLDRRIAITEGVEGFALR